MTHQTQFSARRAGKLLAMYTTLFPDQGLEGFEKWKETLLKTSSHSVGNATTKRTELMHDLSVILSNELLSNEDYKFVMEFYREPS